RVTKSAAVGTGIWTFSGMNTYTGKTTISNGVLAVSSINSVINGNSGSNLGAPKTAADGSIDIGHGLGATLRYIGTGEVTDRIVNVNTNSLGFANAAIDQSGSGLLKF